MASKRVYAVYETVYSARNKMVDYKSKMILARSLGLEDEAEFYNREIEVLRAKIYREQGVLIDCV